MRAELGCLGQTFLHVWSHMGWLICATWPLVWKRGNKVKVGRSVREGGVQQLHCCAGFCYQRRAAAESGPELTDGGGSRELLPRGQQWCKSCFFSISHLSTPLHYICIIYSTSTPASFSFFLQRLYSGSLLCPTRGSGFWLWRMLLPPGGALVPVL